MANVGDDLTTTTAAVVGGGPAGLMCAEVLARAGVGVTVYDHRPSVGWKFLLAGRGGLNITHDEAHEVFAARYGTARSSLEMALTAFGPTQLRAWCAELGEPTFVGSSGRVFPESLRATPLLRAWLKRLADLGVEFSLRQSWAGFGDDGDPTASRFVDPDDTTTVTRTDLTVMALGGASWPRTGSTASWVEPFDVAGVEVAPLRATNCGVCTGWSAPFIERFEGQPLKNVAVSVDDGPWTRGDLVITTRGLEGGPVYAQSAALRGGIERAGTSVLRIDLQPDLTAEQLSMRLAKRRPKESTSTWLRKAGLDRLPVAVLREATDNKLPVVGGEVAVLAKAAPIVVDELMAIDRAISTAGGVRFAEIDQNFMLRKLPGVFVAGEMLDWEAPTGGYLLQACFSTAVAAASGALTWRDLL